MAIVLDINASIFTLNGKKEEKSTLSGKRELKGKRQAVRERPWTRPGSPLPLKKRNKNGGAFMAVEKAIASSSLVEVIDRILDKGVVVDAWVRVSLVGIEILAIEARLLWHLWKRI